MPDKPSVHPTASTGIPIHQWEHCTAVALATVGFQLCESFTLEVTFIEGKKTGESRKRGKYTHGKEELQQ